MPLYTARQPAITFWCSSWSEVENFFCAVDCGTLPLPLPGREFFSDPLDSFVPTISIRHQLYAGLLAGTQNHLQVGRYMFDGAFQPIYCRAMGSTEGYHSQVLSCFSRSDQLVGVSFL